jgi:hypothetical protein
MTYKISCCKECEPPKRHSGCHATCPEYRDERAELDRRNEEHRRKEAVKRYTDAALNLARTRRAKSQLKHDRYHIGSDKK